MAGKELNKLSYGLYVTGVRDEANDRVTGHICDAVAQLSMGEKPQVVVSIMNKNYTKDCIEKSGEFTLSVLPDTVDPFVIGNFGFQSGKDVSKWPNVPHNVVDGLPILCEAVSYVRLKVIDKRVMDSHTAFFCEAIGGEVLHEDKTPLIYADYFKELKDLVMAAFTAFKEAQ
ncbi:MAG: flavin reductase family protein [Clostridiales Family XIII bacterium]|jgi:flavin reductase (DIM6/NTAB) family NADH-FMN oxidoreductase RutF|nr:flavin reductase family protein [Clostridiales Family XIII bacterium]